jgi:glycosyltransferase involved in cell wall biosynthesis
VQAAVSVATSRQDSGARRPVSAVVITLNEARAIDACLGALAWCDEIVVVDSGSTDATVEKARAHGARVVPQSWLGYGKQKDFAVRQASHDWVLCVDADEIVGDELRASIEATLADPAFHAYEMPRRNRFLGRYLRHGEGYPDFNLRLFDRRRAHWSDDPVHENVKTAEPVGRLRGDLLHDSAESLATYLAKQRRYTTIQAQELYRKGAVPNPLKLVLSPLVRFGKFYVLRLGFLDGWPGLVHILIGCANTFWKNAKLFGLWFRRGAPGAR